MQCGIQNEKLKKLQGKLHKKAMNTCNNKDIKDLIPTVIDTIENPENVAETLHKISSTIFVQSVDNATLSIIVPILLRGCQEKKLEC